MKVIHWATLGAALALGVFAWSRWGAMEDAGAPAEGRFRDEQEQVKVKAEIDPSCPKESPIRVTVWNGAGRTLKSVDFHVGVYEEGGADDLAASGPDEPWKIAVAARKTESRCRAVPASVPKRPRYYVRPEKRGTAIFVAPGEDPPSG